MRLIPLDKVHEELKRWLVVVEYGVFKGVVESVVVLEGVTILIHKEDAWDVPYGEWVVVAIIRKICSVKRLKVALIGVYLLEQSVALETLIANLAI